MARKKLLTISAEDQRRLDEMPEGHAKSAYRQYAEFSAHHAMLLDRLDDPKFDGKDGRVPEKYQHEAKLLVEKIDRTGRQMFRAWDNAMATLSRTIHVDEDEIENVIYTTLMENSDAIPSDQELSGLERGRKFRSMAADLVGMLKTDKVQIVEEETGLPFCPSCEEEVLG